MAKLARDDDGLMPKEAMAAKLFASGLNQSEAYRAAFDSRSKPSIVHSKASILFAKPAVPLWGIARIRPPVLSS